MKTLETTTNAEISPELQRFYDICEQHGWRQEKIDAAAKTAARRENPRDWEKPVNGKLHTYLSTYYPIVDTQVALDALEAYGRISDTIQSGLNFHEIERRMIEANTDEKNRYIAIVQELNALQKTGKTFGGFTMLCQKSSTIHEPLINKRGNRSMRVTHPLHTIGKQIEEHTEKESLMPLLRSAHNSLLAIKQQLPNTRQSAENTEDRPESIWQNIIQNLQEIQSESSAFSTVFDSNNTSLLKAIETFLEEFSVLRSAVDPTEKENAEMIGTFDGFYSNNDKNRRKDLQQKIVAIRDLLDSPTKFIVAVKSTLHDYDAEKKSGNILPPQIPKVVQGIARNTLVQIMSVIVAIGTVSITYNALRNNNSQRKSSTVVAKKDTPPVSVIPSNTKPKQQTPSAVPKTTKEEQAQFRAMANTLKDSFPSKQPEPLKAEEKSTEPDSIDQLFDAVTGYKPNEPQKTKAPENTTAASLPPVALSLTTNTEPPLAKTSEKPSVTNTNGASVLESVNNASSELATDTDIFDNQPNTDAEIARAEEQKKRYERMEAHEKAAQEQRARAFAEKQQAEEDRLAKAEKEKVEPVNSAASLPPITLRSEPADVSLNPTTTDSSVADLITPEIEVNAITSAPKPIEIEIHESEVIVANNTSMLPGITLDKEKNMPSEKTKRVQPMIAESPTLAYKGLATPITLENTERLTIERQHTSVTLSNTLLEIQLPEPEIRLGNIERASFDLVLPTLPEIDHTPLPRREFSMQTIEPVKVPLPTPQLPATESVGTQESKITQAESKGEIDVNSIDVRTMTKDQFIQLSPESQEKVLKRMRELVQKKQGK